MSGYSPGTPEYREHIRDMVARSQMSQAQRDQADIDALLARYSRAVGPFQVLDGGQA